MLTVAFDRFSIDKAVLDDFVRVVARGDLTKDAAKRVLWAMLYADDAGIASQSQASLEKMMTAIVEVCAAFGLIVSEKKTVRKIVRQQHLTRESATNKNIFIFLFQVSRGWSRTECEPLR